MLLPPGLKTSSPHQAEANQEDQIVHPVHPSDKQIREDRTPATLNESPDDFDFKIIRRVLSFDISQKFSKLTHNSQKLAGDLYSKNFNSFMLQYSPQVSQTSFFDFSIYYQKYSPSKSNTRSIQYETPNYWGASISYEHYLGSKFSFGISASHKDQFLYYEDSPNNILIEKIPLTSLGFNLEHIIFQHNNYNYSLKVGYDHILSNRRHHHHKVKNGYTVHASSIVRGLFSSSAIKAEPFFLYQKISDQRTDYTHSVFGLTIGYEWLGASK